MTEAATDKGRAVSGMKKGKPQAVQNMPTESNNAAHAEVRSLTDNSNQADRNFKNGKKTFETPPNAKKNKDSNVQEAFYDFSRACD